MQLIWIATLLIAVNFLTTSTFAGSPLENIQGRDGANSSVSVCSATDTEDKCKAFCCKFRCGEYVWLASIRDCWCRVHPEFSEPPKPPQIRNEIKCTASFICKYLAENGKCQLFSPEEADIADCVPTEEKEFINC